jgi:hypothetical protein
MAIAGGTPTIVASTELYNGTSWTEVGDLATARRYAGTSTATGTDSAFCAGGLPSMDNTEEWDGAPVAAKTVTTS